MSIAGERTAPGSVITLPTKLEVFNEYVAGCAGGITGLLVGHPFDTVKVLLQTQHSSAEFRSMRHCISVVGSYALSKGFFRGLSAPLVSQAAANAVYFGTFFNCKYHLLPRFVESQSARDYIAGCIAGTLMLSISVPVDVLKIAMQSQIGRENSSRMYSSAFGCARELLRRGGLRSAYRGLSIQALTWVPSSGLYFWLYETGKRRLLGKWDLSPYATSMLVGGLAGTFSWLSVAPLDVLKSRMQADPTGSVYRSWLQCARHTWSLGGFRALFRGTSVLLVRAFPVNAITFVTYEYAIDMLSRMQTPTLP